MLTLTAANYALTLNPALGGSIASFTYRGQPLMRPGTGRSVLDTACFPLVPFSNRIAHGRFFTPDHAVSLAPNLPDSDHPHVLHGFGWLAEWQAGEVTAASATLHHQHPAGAWPWPYAAQQTFTLTEAGLTHHISVQNQGETPMPAGLGFHPYFPCNAQTLFHSLHRGEWQTTPDCLPTSLTEHGVPRDWWAGQPVASRSVDTAYTDRFGPLTIQWPDRALSLTLTPSDNLPATVIYTPVGEAYFCAEPVTHTTDAINRAGASHPMHWLATGESLTVTLGYKASALR